MASALIVWGGWAGHQPKEVAEVFRRVLVEDGVQVEVSDTLDAFKDEAKLMALDLIIPIWTMGEITKEQVVPVLKAVREGGVGIAGCHGGMGDAFRKDVSWQFMVGGQWIAHPGNDGTLHTIRIKNPDHPITKGIKDFDVKSEQYYMHIDPAIQVLATTTFPTPGVDGPHVPNGFTEVPQVWTKYWGKGRVFYNALGHQANIFDIPEALELMRRGFRWARKDRPKCGC
ncbi:MAG: ThuA domain-containing protein [Phycisphaerales bacterium]|nr:ThuA domain-containing protein [Phycisphaerales bacterium]